MAEEERVPDVPLPDRVVFCAFHLGAVNGQLLTENDLGKALQYNYKDNVGEGSQLLERNYRRWIVRQLPSEEEKDAGDPYSRRKWRASFRLDIHIEDICLRALECQNPGCGRVHISRGMIESPLHNCLMGRESSICRRSPDDGYSIRKKVHLSPQVLFVFLGEQPLLSPTHTPSGRNSWTNSSPHSFPITPKDTQQKISPDTGY